MLGDKLGARRRAMFALVPAAAWILAAPCYALGLLSPSPAVAGSPVTVTATVIGSQNDDPSGVVLFLVNGSVIGESTLTRTGNITVVATFQTGQPRGVQRVEAVYLGDTRFRASKALISLIVH